MADENTGWQGFAADRLTFFSDAVVAIAITLLALDLPVPGDHFWQDVAKSRADYVAFLISFAVIGSHWFGHHTVFSQLARPGGRVLRWNMLWLLMIVLIPFATRVLVADGSFVPRFVFYAAIQTLAALVFILAVRDMDRYGLLRPGTDGAVLRRSYHRLSAIGVGFLVSIPLAFVTHWAYVCWAVVPLTLRLTQRLRGVAARLLSRRAAR